MMNHSMSFLDYTYRAYLKHRFDIAAEEVDFKEISDWIDEINAAKKNNPNMDISEFIKEKFGEERGGELFEKYSAYIEIMKDGFTGLEQSVEDFKKSVIDKIDEYLKEVVKIEQTLKSKQMDQILEPENLHNELFRIPFNQISNYEILDRKEFDKLVSLNRRINILSETIKNFKKDIDCKINYGMIGCSKMNQFNELCKQFTREEKSFMAALLIIKPENRNFFENYQEYQVVPGIKSNMEQEIKKRDGEFINKISQIKGDLKLRRINDIEIYDKVSKFIPVEPNVFIKYLPKAEGNVYSIRENCCLEFDLKYNVENGETTLIMFFDTYNISGGGRFKRFAKRYKCNNIKRYKLGEYSCQGNQPIGFVIKSSKEAQNIINVLNAHNISGTAELLDVLRKKRIEFMIKRQYGYDRYVEVIKEYLVNDNDIRNRIFEKGFARLDHDKIIYFEDFNDNEGRGSFRIVDIDEFILRRPIEEECKLFLEHKELLIDRVQNSAELTDETKVNLVNKIRLDQLSENDKIFLMNEIRSDILQRLNAQINEISEDRINLFLFDEINNLSTDELSKIDELDLSGLDEETKLALAEVIYFAKFEKGLLNKIMTLDKVMADELMADLKRFMRSDNTDKSSIIVEGFNFWRFSIDTVREIMLNILTDNQKWEDRFAHIRNPQDQEHNSIFDFREVFGNMTQEDREGRIVLPIIPRVQNIERNEEREKALLKTVVTLSTIKETMENILYLERRSIITAKNMEKGELYYTVDSMAIQDAQQLKAKDLEDAKKEMEQSFQTGRVVDKK